MKIFAALVGSIFIGLYTSTYAQAQTNRSATNTVGVTQSPSTNSEKLNRSDFEIAFASLSRKYKLAFVCEGAPYKPTLSPTQVMALQKKITATPSPSPKDEISIVALAYDYEAVFQNEHTVLLTKKYSQSKDLPEITLDEACLYLNNLIEEASPYADPSKGSVTKGSTNTQLNKVIIDLYKAATPEQKAAYAKGVRWGNLPTDVQTKWTYSQSAVSLGVPLDAFWSAACRLNGVKKPNATVFKKVDYHGVILPAYEGPFRSPQRADRWSVVLGAYMKTNIGGGTTYEQPGGFVMKQGKIVNPLPDPTTPTKEELAVPTAPLSSCQKTLAQAAVDMNARVANHQTDKTIRIEIPTAIKEKTVSLFGAETYLSPLQETKAIAAVYGFRGVQGKDGVATISLPKALPNLDPTQFWTEALNALPVPVFRALRGPSLSPSEVENHSLISSNQINRVKAGSIYIEATKKLRILIEPKLTDGKLLPIADTPPECKDLIALASFVDIVGWLQDLARPREPLTKQIAARAKMTFKMFQEGDQITYNFIDGGFMGGSTFPVSEAQPQQ